ncbi:transporter substrate-binding domain-containing protein [Cetobacterium somerae]|uniref:HD domain-containing phosphohydrolase n=1 Tax=Cetobacterium sp. NK01 TaxID=2993530 RepID=UPI00211666C8|nr:HD domain-containing phosphohydrolase [Cetobacterium sp. NK01]MCQ8212231.1 transporter substrate-binding domain-containing protein [Cetobacterium sp. NK01]
MFKSFFLFFLIFLNAFSLDLTKSEKSWIKENKNKVFLVDSYNPNHVYLYKKDSGELAGVYIEFFEKLEQETGLKFKIQASGKNKMKNLLTNGEGDILFNVAKTAQREKNYFFIPTYNTYNVGLFSKKGTSLNLNNINKYKIGHIEGTSDSILIQEFYPNFKNLTSVDDNGNFGFSALENNEVDAIVGKSSNDIFKHYNFTPLNDIPSSQLWMVVNKKYPILRDIIEKFRLDFSEQDVVKSLKKERLIFYKQLLKDDPVIGRLKKNYKNFKVLIPGNGDIVPLFYSSKNGYKGYVVDRLNELSYLTDIPIYYTNNPKGNYDIKAIDTKIFDSSEKYFIPYYASQLAAFSLKNNNFVDSYSDIKNKKIGLVSYETLKINDIKNLTTSNSFRFFEDTKSALTSLLNKDIDYLYGDFKIISMAISNEYLESDIKVAGFFNKITPVGFGIKSDSDLANFIDKLFPSHLSESKILYSELVVPRKLSPNYKYFLILFLISTSIISILFYFLRKAIIATKKERLITRALVESFEAANELNDEDTGNHILRVNLYSKLLAEKLKCNKKFIEEIGEYASLHDIGKIGVSDSILKKPGKLSPHEFEEMKKHVLLGKKLIDKMQLGTVAQNVALYHHEKWNGKGYYYGLKESEIPLEARIVALADVYDALRQKRVYKHGFSHEETVEIIKKERGQHFDPTLVDIFLDYHNEFDKIFIEH